MPRPRASSLLTAAALALALSSACGSVVLVDPDQALKDSLVITAAERLIIEGDPRVYLHVRIANRSAIDRVRLFVDDPAGRTELPLDRAHRQHCGRVETCLAITLGPGLAADAGPLVLAVPELAHEDVAPIAIVHLGSYRPSASAERRNTALVVAIDDPIRTYYAAPKQVEAVVDGEIVTEGEALLFPRTFEAVSEPGACRGPADPAASGWAMRGTEPFGLAAAFDDAPDPWTCVSVRPAEPAGGSAVGAVSVRARALAVRFDHEYVPPVDVSPLVFVPIFDLDLAGDVRCTQARELVRSSILEAATDIAASDGGGAEVLELDPIDVAESEGVLCRQTNDRTLSGRAEAERILNALDGAFGASRRVRVVLVYATNLNLPLPAGLAQELEVLSSALDLSDQRRVAVVAIGPERPLGSIHADRLLAWLATDEPTFRDQITQTLRTLWPFRTVVHTDATVVPLVGAADRGRYLRWRVCSSSQEVTPLGVHAPHEGALIPPPGGPAYTVHLDPLVLAPPSRFTLPRVSVSWEGCEGLCDHQAPTGASTWPWTVAPFCP